MRLELLFRKLLDSQKEINVKNAFEEDAFALEWCPLGGNENNFDVIDHQQASPIAALIERLTNSIDAILMKRCLESGINTKSELAPDSTHSEI